MLHATGVRTVVLQLAARGAGRGRQVSVAQESVRVGQARAGLGAGGAACLSVQEVRGWWCSRCCYCCCFAVDVVAVCPFLVPFLTGSIYVDLEWRAELNKAAAAHFSCDPKHPPPSNQAPRPLESRPPPPPKYTLSCRNAPSCWPQAEAHDRVAEGGDEAQAGHGDTGDIQQP